MKVTKEVVDYVAEKTGIRETALVEKDLIIHLLLNELAADERFRSHYVFKGGTCLIKCYLGYYRFSEDLDFTYTRQDDFEGKSEKQIRKQLSEEINWLAAKLETIAVSIGLDFKADKQNPHYMEFGGSNKFTTFKLGYASTELKTRQFVKIQINYVEEIKYPFKTLEAKSNFDTIDLKEFSYLYPNEAERLLTQPNVQAYDIREILAEKVRAILTRKGVKARDFIDVYLIQKETGTTLKDVEVDVIEKTKFILKYEKYRENLEKKTTTPPAFKLGGEEKLLLKPLDKDFRQHQKQLTKYLETLIETLTRETKE